VIRRVRIDHSSLSAPPTSRRPGWLSGPEIRRSLIDVADPTELAIVTAEEGCATFLFLAAPPRLHAASGVPLNPLAIF